MTMMPGMGPKGQTQAILFDPNKEREARRKKQLAELLVAKGNQPLRNEVAGGMTVKRSPWENLAQGAEKYLGEYQLEKADKQGAEVDAQRARLFQEALSQLESNPQGAAQILTQDPNLAPDALKLYQQALSDQRAEDLKREQWGHEKELFGMRAASGGNTPAAIQISNKLFELEQTMNNPNTPLAERVLAQRQYNLLGQSAKTYGFDRGLQVNGIGDYGDVFNSPAGTNSDFEDVPPVDLNAPVPMGQTPNAPLRPDQYPQDPVAANQAAVANRQNEIGANPYQQNFTVGEIPGYGQATADITARKKAAETIAESNAKYMAEGRQRLPQAQRALQAAELRNENISRIAQKSMQISNNAFTTGFTGSIMDAVAGSPAFDLKNNLQTLEATAAFDTLQNMRDNSPTGGALGNVTERELDLLKAAYSNLLNSQSREQFQENLNAFMRQNQQALQNARVAYEQDYQRFGGQADQFLPPPQSTQTLPVQGQIAVNPQTGERLINYGNGWEPYNGN